MKSGNQSRFSLPGTAFSPLEDEVDAQTEEVNKSSKKKKKA